jgi:hypothetical protein
MAGLRRRSLAVAAADERRREPVLGCFLLGFVSFVTLLLAGFTAFFVLVYRGAEAPDPKLLYDLAFGLLAMSGAPRRWRSARMRRWCCATGACPDGPRFSPSWPGWRTSRCCVIPDHGGLFLT